MQHWFDEYTTNFSSTDRNIQQNFEMKILHTKEVVKNINQLSSLLSLDKQGLALAGISALFHDIGRFEQFQRYKTFADKFSTDHGELGVEILQRYKVLEILAKEDKDIVLSAIKWHNKLEIPPTLDTKTDFFARLLRDADKLDIFRIVTEYYHKLATESDQNSAIVLGLPNNDKYSEEIIEEILEGKIVKSQNLKTVNDFKLLQMAWVFDINFQPTFQILHQKKYIEKIFLSLPDDKNINHVYEVIKNHLDRNCKRKNNYIVF